MIKSKMRRVWVEKMTMLDAMYLAGMSRFLPLSVMYDENRITAAAGLLMRIAGNWKIFFPADLTLDRQDERGGAVNYHLEDAQDSYLNAFCADHISGEVSHAKSAARLYIASFLNYRATFIAMAESHDKFGSLGYEDILYLERHPVNSVMLRYYRQTKGYNIKESLGCLSVIKYFIRPAAQLSAAILLRFDPRRVYTNIREKRPAIWVEYVHKDVVDFTAWRDRIDEKQFDVVCYLDRYGRYSVGEQAEAIEKKGLKYIDLRFASLVKIASLGWKELGAILVAFFHAGRKTPFWFRVYRLEYAMYKALYSRVFIKYAVKTLLQHQEAYWIQFPQVDALDASGGIMVGCNWSNLPYYKIAFWDSPQHVYFVWGKIFYEWLKKKPAACRNILPSGVWMFPDAKKISTVDMSSNGERFRLAIFDSSIDYRIYNDKRTLTAFYIKVLGMIEDNPLWSGMAKSKNWTFEDLKKCSFSKQLVDIMERLMGQGRFVYLDPALSPLEVASKVDLSVCYGLNSAGIIAGIFGNRAIHWDNCGWLSHPIYKDHSQRFLFRTLDEAGDAITSFSRGDPTIGDLSGWRKYFNHFSDNLGADRIGGFIQLYMEQMNNSGDSARSLQETVNEYIADHEVGAEFFNYEDMWAH